MNVSKFSIGEETLNRISNMSHISRKRKSMIRRDGVVALIKSKPSGHEFSNIDLMVAAGYRVSSASDTQYASGHAFIRGMIDRGEIIQFKNTLSRKSSYIVPSDVKMKYSTRKSNNNNTSESLHDLSETPSTGEFPEVETEETVSTEESPADSVDESAELNAIKRLAEEIVKCQEERRLEDEKYALNETEVNISEEDLAKKADEPILGEYGFSIKIYQRKDSGSYGLKDVSDLHMDDVSSHTMRKMINYLLDNVQ